MLRSIPLPHMPVVKDLVPDLTRTMRQYASIEPWLKTDTPPPERERPQSPAERARLDGFGNASSASAAPPPAPAIGGTATAISARRFCSRPIAGSPTAATRATGERLDQLEDPFRLYRCHTIMNCTRTCPKGLNPAKAIAEIKKLMLARR